MEKKYKKDCQICEDDPKACEEKTCPCHNFGVDKRSTPKENRLMYIEPGQIGRTIFQSKENKEVVELARKLQKDWMEAHDDWRTPVWAVFRDEAERILGGKENKEECEGGMCPINIQGKVIHSTTCPLSAPQTPDSINWEEEFDEIVDYEDLEDIISVPESSPEVYMTRQEYLRSLIKKWLALAHSSGRREVAQKIIDGINETIRESDGDFSWYNGLRSARSVAENELVDKDLT